MFAAQLFRAYKTLEKLTHRGQLQVSNDMSQSRGFALLTCLLHGGREGRDVDVAAVPLAKISTQSNSATTHRSADQHQ